MNRFVIFIINLIRKATDDELFERAAGLTYRIMLAFFPFLIFLIALLGFMNLDDSVMLERLYSELPADIGNLVDRFLGEVYHMRSKELLSTSLFFSVYNTANGFRAVIRSINKAYDFKDTRNIFIQVGISLLLMLTFALSIILMLVLLVFGNHIWGFLSQFLPESLESLYAILSALVSLVVLVAATTMIYKLACARKVSLLDVSPGAIITVLLWVVSSKVFSHFITHYSRYSILYGSIAGVFILIMWLNLISLILLIGNEINSMLVIE